MSPTVTGVLLYFIVPITSIVLYPIFLGGLSKIFKKNPSNDEAGEGVLAFILIMILIVIDAACYDYARANGPPVWNFPKINIMVKK